MKIVAVTACATGIAHTYMAAEKLTKTASALGISIKVETQGALGVEHRLTAKDIQEADVAILASDIGIEGGERFDKVPVIRVRVADAIKDPKAIFDKAAARRA